MDRKAQKMKIPKEPMITSLRVTVSKEKSYTWRWLKILCQEHIKAFVFLVFDFEDGAVGMTVLNETA